MKKINFFIFTLTVWLNAIAMEHDAPALATIPIASGQLVVIKPLVDNFAEHEPLFRAVYAALYAKHPHVMVDRIKQFSSINAIARFAYEQDKKEFDAHQPTAYFVQAVLDEKPIGYFSFFIQSDGSVYADKMLIDPMYQGIGIAKHLVSSIFMLRPEATKVNLVTHRENLTAVNMYKQHGCVEVPIPATQAWADPKSWIALEYTKK